MGACSRISSLKQTSKLTNYPKKRRIVGACRQSLEALAVLAMQAICGRHFWRHDLEICADVRARQIIAPLAFIVIFLVA